MLELQGFDSIIHSEVRYIDIKEAISSFRPLYEYNSNYYVRTTVTLTDEQFDRYRMMLTVPKNKTDFYIRIMSPFVVWDSGEGLYLVNGNSRFATICQLYKSQEKLEYAPIPYTVITGEMSQAVAERIQYDSNDTTRRNSSVERLKRVQAFLDQAVNNGMKLSVARQYVSKYFGVSQQTLSNAKALFNKHIPESLQDMLDQELATTDAAVKVMQAAEKFTLSPNQIIGEVMAKATKGKLTASGVENWRKQYVSKQENQDIQAVGIENFLSETNLTPNPDEDDQVLFFNTETNPITLGEFNSDDSETSEPEVVQKSEIMDILDATVVEQNALLLKIASSILSELPQEDSARYHEAIKNLINSLLANNDPSPELLEKIRRTLK